MKKKYISKIQRKSRLRETKQKKINKRKFYGVKGNIKKYSNDIFKTFHDEDLLKQHLATYSEKLNESLVDVFMQYVSDLHNRFNDLLDKAQNNLSESFEKGTKRVMDKEGDYIEAPDVDAESEVDFLVNEQKTYYKNMTELQSKAINRVVSKGKKEGKSYEEIADNVMNTNKRITQNRANAIARSEVVKSNNMGQVKTLKSAGAKKYNFIHSGDKKVCPICKNYQGASGREKIYEVERAGTKDHPLPVQNTHPNCFSDDTEVLTKEGWKYFKDVEKGDLIFSLNPKNKEVGWQEAIEKVEYYHKGNMIRFYNDYNFDCLVTPDHNFWFYKPYHSNKLKKEYASTIAKRKNFHIPRKGDYNSKKEKIWINGKKYDGKEIMRFLGWYLSEGSTTKRGNYYQIKLSQNNPSDIVKDIKFMEDKLRIGKDAIYLFDYALGKFLYTLGKSYEKYLPEEFKELSKECLKEFLRTYLKGDGSHRKVKEWKGQKFNNEKIYLTSSDKLASDIGELIIKTGKYPSYSKDEIKKKQKFSNGIYDIKHPCWRIRECSKNTQFIEGKYGKKEWVNYEGKVYDVELKEWHILYVRRKGKCFWSGNCRCVIVYHS